MPTVIGIGGRLASGKDATAEHLEAHHGFVRIGMSDPLLQSMIELDPIINMDFFDSNKPDTQFTVRFAEIVEDLGYVEAKKHPEVRRLLQVFGTDVMRNMFGDDVWVDIARRTIQGHTYCGSDVVITGLRYPNEVEMIRELGGRTWWVDRPGYDVGAAHISENGVNVGDFQKVVKNHGTLDDLCHTVDDLLEGTG